MAVQDDVTTARDAVRALERAAAALVTHFGSSVDAQRLTADIQRVAQDLDLLAGATAPPRPAPQLQVIDDTAYPQDFWMDAEDEGLGGGR